MYTLLPVSAKLATDEQLAAYPDLAKAAPANWRPYKHQVETYAALNDDRYDIVINTSMTGAGKSLAGQTCALADTQYNVLTLYPTNELIQDQLRSAQLTWQRWNSEAKYVATLYGARLDELDEQGEVGSRGDNLIRVLKNHQLILSNPDILHAIMQFAYTYGRAPDQIAAQLLQMFRQITFDEFHIFDVPQVAAVLTGLLFLYEIKGSYPFKTLFLSATPGDVLIPLLDRAGFKDRICQITSEYSYDLSPDSAHWRVILQPLTLHLAPSRAEEWVAAHLDDTLIPFFQRHGKAAKGAIIVNSLAAAHRLTALLQAKLKPLGIEVLPNTGLTGKRNKEVSYAADILVGTSTVDVGVDFQINFLVFEANDARTFMQRLGRAGRHTSYTADGLMHTFTAFEAHALVPQFVHDRLTKGYKDQPAFLAADRPLQRDELQEAINRAFPQPANYKRYLSLWGRFQPLKVIVSLSDKTIKDSYTDVKARLIKKYDVLFQASMNAAYGANKQMNRDHREQLVIEAQSFRGGSPFDCGVLVAGEHEPMTYNLMWLLMNSELEMIDKNMFLDEVERRGYAKRPFTRGRHVAFFRMHSARAQREPVTVDLNLARGIDWNETSRAQVIERVQFDCRGVPWLNQLNRHLAERKVVALVQPGYQPDALLREVYLPGIFPLYAYEGNGSQGSVAFGRQALILDTMLRHKKLDDHATAMYG